MRYSFLIAIIIFLFAGCSKDKFTTAPQLKYKSVNSKVIGRGADLIFDLGFTDAEGDISDTLFIQHVSFSGCTNTFDSTFGYVVPEITGGQLKEGTISLSFSYGNSSGAYPNLSPSSCGGTDSDTCYFRFMLKDKAGNKSDTINSETIVLLP